MYEPVEEAADLDLSVQSLLYDDVASEQKVGPSETNVEKTSQDKSNKPRALFTYSYEEYGYETISRSNLIWHSKIHTPSIGIFEITNATSA